MGRALLIPLLATALVYSQDATPAQQPASQHIKAPVKQKADAKSKTVKASAKPAESLVMVYRFPAFCLNKTNGLIKVVPAQVVDAVESAKPCVDPEIRLQAQSASDVAKALSSEADYSIAPSGTDRLVIYRKKDQPSPTPAVLEQQIVNLAWPTFVFSEPLRVPAGTATQIAPLVAQLNSAGITADPVGIDHILLKSPAYPDDQTLDNLKMRISSLGWKRPSSPPTQRLFYLDADKTLKSLSGGAADKSDASAGGAKSGSTDKSADGSKATSATSSPSVSVTVTATGTQEEAPAKSAGQSDDQGAGAKADSSGSASDTAAKAKPAATAKVTDSTKKSSDEPKPLNMQAVTDTLVYSNADGGDEGISERARLMTMLDLPRPEILLNLLSFQASSKDYKVVTADSEAVRMAVASHNDVLQDAIENGWDYLSQQMKQSDFFDSAFYTYITQKFSYDPVCGPGEVLKSLEPTIQAPVEVPHSKCRPKMSSEPPFLWILATSRYRSQRDLWGWCPPDTYCLGFAHAFEPLRPTFTNILLALAAAGDPAGSASATINAMSKCDPAPCPPEQCPKPCAKPKGEEDQQRDEEKDKTGQFLRCSQEKARDIEQRLIQQSGGNEFSGDCELVDRLSLMRQVENQQTETLQLSCFKRQAGQSFAGESSKNKAPAKYATTRVGLLRAAVADFLFNYKMATQYPHDFIPYDLVQSAQELNAEFDPLILSFNRDVAAFTQHLQTVIECEEQIDEPTGSKTFINDAMITVRGISGVESVVNTVTQNYFDATNPPSLTDLVQSISAAQKNVPGVLKANLTADEAAVLLGALNSVQPAQAKIGRELNLDITPHALPGASSAELEVKLTNQETSDPTRYESGKKSEDDLSRVAKHDTITRVRVESLKLFDVSSFSAKLQRPRSNFPLILPFFELPYFGSFLSWPLKGATEYHRSTAVVSAVIVPTAADLAFGIDFGADRVCGEQDPDYGLPCHKAKSFDDFRGLPLRNFHKAMVQCFATGEINAYGGVQLLSESTKTTARSALKERGLNEPRCDSLKLSEVPPSE